MTSTPAIGDGNLIVAPSEIDEATAPTVLRQIETFVAQPNGHSSVILDLGATAFLDSSGMGMLTRAHTMCSDAGIRLLLHSPTPNVTTHLRMIGLLTFFEWTG